MWDLLEWEGKHPQAPVAVVAKPHYFSQLNIVRTIGNLADDCPDFWTSEEFCKSMANGELLTSHAEYFSKVSPSTLKYSGYPLLVLEASLQCCCLRVFFPRTIP